MSKPNPPDAIILSRRALVAALLLESLTQRAIQAKVAEQFGDVSLGTINSDVKAVKADWRKAARQKVEEHTALHLARTESIIADLWPDRKNPRVADVILKTLDRQAHLLGTDKPTAHEVRATVGAFGVEGLTEAEKRKIVGAAYEKWGYKPPSAECPLTAI